MDSQKVKRKENRRKKVCRKGAVGLGSLVIVSSFDWSILHS